MSLLLDTIRQIRSGYWALEPHYGLSLKDVVENIFSQNFNDALKKENLEARHYIIDENGTTYQSKNLEEAPNKSIGIIHITGPMIKYGNWFCYGSDELVAKAIEFENSPNIIGIIFKIDTGGGAVNAVAPYRDFLKNKTKPVVALCDMCASAGYWVAAGTDYLMAENNISSMFGSIGVMATIRDAQKYWKDLGIKDHVINADQSDYKNKEFEEVLKGNYKPIRQELLNPLAVQFQETVKSDRKKLKLETEGIISGKMFYAEQAVEIGLADSIGNMQQAIEKIKELAAVQNFMYN